MHTEVFVLALFAALGNVLGTLVFARVRSVSFHVRYSLLGFSAGFLMAITVLDIMPTLFERWGTTGFVYMLIGFFLLFLVQQWLDPSQIHTHHVEEPHLWVSNQQYLHDLLASSSWVYSVLLGLMVHSLMDGILLASAATVESHLGRVVFMGILIHKFPVGLTLAAVMVATGAPFAYAWWGALGMGAMTLLGAAGMQALQAWVPLGLALSAGTLLYVVTVEFLPIVYHAPRRWYTLPVVGGLLIGGLAVYTFHPHG